MAGFGKGANGAEREKDMAAYRVKLTGIRPILLHWDNIGWQDMLAKWRSVPENKKESVPGDDRSPAMTWKGYTYNDGENVVIPYDNIRSCLMAAGKKVPKGKGRGSMKAEAASAIIIDSMYVPLLVNGKTISWPAIEAIDGKFSDHVTAARNLGFDLFVKRAKVGQSKHIRVRPIFDKWSLQFDADILDDSLTQDVLVDLFRMAGKYVGLGDWRPGSEKSPGPYGMFTADVSPL